MDFRIFIPQFKRSFFIQGQNNLERFNLNKYIWRIIKFLIYVKVIFYLKMLNYCLITNIFGKNKLDKNK